MSEATLFDPEDLSIYEGRHSVPDVNPPKTIQESFETYHTLNPRVYQELVRLARELRYRGHMRLGIGMLWEVLRWHFMLTTEDPGSAFKLNDHYRSRYVRLIVRQEHDLAQCFELRELRAL